MAMRQTDTRRKISLAGLPVELDERERFTGCGAGNNRQSNTILARNELGVLLKQMVLVVAMAERRGTVARVMMFFNQHGVW